MNFLLTFKNSNDQLLRVKLIVGAYFAAIPFYWQMRAVEGNFESDLLPLDTLVLYVWILISPSLCVQNNIKSNRKGGANCRGSNRGGRKDGGDG